VVGFASFAVSVVVAPAVPVVVTFKSFAIAASVDADAGFAVVFASCLFL
jgi:hypothetical protein